MKIIKINEDILKKEKENLEDFDINRIDNYEGLDSNNISINKFDDFDEDDNYYYENEDINRIEYEHLKKFYEDYDYAFGNSYRSFDMRYLKKKIWQQLQKLMEENSKDKDAEKSGIKFNDLINSMSKVIPYRTRKNINEGIYFTCILHIANEKSIF